MNMSKKFPQGRSLRPVVLVSVLLAGRIFFAPPAAGTERTHSGHSSGFISQLVPGPQDITIPTLDISGETDRHVMIEKGTPEIRQGHANTVLLPDGKTMFVAWTHGHGGSCGPFKKSSDGGRTWSDLLAVPENWKEHANCPAMYRLTDPVGTERLFIFVNIGPSGFIMYQSQSEDEGRTWSPYEPARNSKDGILGEGELPAPTVMPFTAIVPVRDGKELLGVTNLRRPGEKGPPSNIIAQSRSSDGGLSWTDWKIILDLGEPFRPCEPELIQSPDGKQLLMLIRENRRTFNSWIMLSDDEGKTWSLPFQASHGVTMDRHQHRYASDGRLVVVGRDNAIKSPTRRHFVAWVGTYEELASGRDGEYRVKLLHSNKGNVEYPSLEVLPDGTFVAVNSVTYHPEENYSLVSTRFTMDELDQKFRELKK